MVNIPCAMTFGSPTAVAIRSFQWITLKSPDAPAYITRLTRCTGNVCAGSSAPTSISSYPIRVAIVSALPGGAAGDERGVRRHHVLAVHCGDLAAGADDVVAGRGPDVLHGHHGDELVAG